MIWAKHGQMSISGRSFCCGGVIVTALRRVCVAGLMGAWLVAGGAQEAAEEAVAGDQEQQVAAPESGSIAADETPEAGTSEQPETAADTTAADTTAADAGVTDAGVTDAGAADAGAAFPEIAPLDELFVPSQNIRADEPVTFPVDF